MKMTVKILKTSEGLTKVQEYNLRTAQTEKMREAEGADLRIGGWMLTENTDDKGETFRALIIQEAGDDGLIYSTSSDAFIDQFLNALDDLGAVNTIRVEVRKAKKTGREYLSFKLVA